MGLAVSHCGAAASLKVSAPTSVIDPNTTTKITGNNMENTIAVGLRSMAIRLAFAMEKTARRGLKGAGTKQLFLRVNVSLKRFNKPGRYRF